MKSFKYILFINSLIIGILVSTSILMFFGIKDYQEIRTETRNDAYEFAKNYQKEAISIYENDGLSGNKILTENKIKSLISKNPDTKYLSIHSFDGSVLLGPKESEKIKTIVSQEPYFLSRNKIYFKKDQLKVNSPFSIIVPDNKGSYVVQFVFEDTKLFLLYSRLGLILFFASLGVISLSFIISRKVSSNISKPIENLSQTMKEYGKTGQIQDVCYTDNMSMEVNLLTKTFSQMEIDLDIAHKEHIEKVKTDQEIILAGQIQQRFLPKSGFHNGNISIDGILVPATKVGGDMYDIIEIGKDQILFYPADVTGHGVSAGVVSSMISSGVDILSANKSKIDGNDLKALCISLHQVLFKKTDSDVFATMLIGYLDKKSGDITTISCGHEQGIIYRRSENTLEMLPKGGLALGLIKEVEATLNITKSKLNKGDCLYIYSDGVPEAWNNKKEKLDMERWENIVKQNESKGKTSLEKIIKDIQEFTNKHPFEDDVTIVRVGF